VHRAVSDRSNPSRARRRAASSQKPRRERETRIDAESGRALGIGASERRRPKNAVKEIFRRESPPGSFWHVGPLEAAPPLVFEDWALRAGRGKARSFRANSVWSLPFPCLLPRLIDS